MNNPLILEIITVTITVSFYSKECQLAKWINWTLLHPIVNWPDNKSTCKHVEDCSELEEITQNFESKTYSKT